MKENISNLKYINLYCIKHAKIIPRDIQMFLKKFVSFFNS